MILQSLVTSADKNSDGAMDWKEFEGFGNFELVFKRWPQMWKTLQDDLLAVMNTCGGEEEMCFPSSWTTEDLKRCLIDHTSHQKSIHQVLLQFRGDHSTPPQLVLPRRLPVWLCPNVINHTSIYVHMTKTWKSVTNINVS